jgi:hypothetical protein
MLENFTQIKAGLNVMMKRSKKKKQDFVMVDQKNKERENKQEEIRLNIKSWLGKELFNNIKNSNQVNRSNSNVDSHSRQNIAERKRLFAGIKKMSSMNVIEIDSNPQKKRSSDRNEADSAKVVLVL